MGTPVETTPIRPEDMPRARALAFLEKHRDEPVDRLPELACLEWVEQIGQVAPPLRPFLPKFRAHLEGFWK
jgi:hypothetical protein